MHILNAKKKMGHDNNNIEKKKKNSIQYGYL